jgi:hypothetical protein
MKEINHIKELPIYLDKESVYIFDATILFTFHVKKHGGHSDM